jgi:hypothetical protein
MLLVRAPHHGLRRIALHLPVLDQMRHLRTPVARIAAIARNICMRGILQRYLL